MEDDVRLNTVVSVGSVILAFLLFGFVLQLLARDLDAQAKKIIESRSVSSDHVRLIGTLARLKKIAPQAGKYGEQLRLLLPTKDELLDFPRWLSSVSRTHEVTSHFVFQGGTVMPQPEEPGYVGFTLNASGASENLEKFFRELETTSSRFLLALDSFEVTQSEGAYRAFARGRIFFQ